MDKTVYRRYTGILNIVWCPITPYWLNLAYTGYLFAVSVFLVFHRCTRLPLSEAKRVSLNVIQVLLLVLKTF